MIRRRSTACLCSPPNALSPLFPLFSCTATALQAETSTRSEFFVQLAGVVAAGAAFPGIASAAQYGSLGRGSPNVGDPKEAIIDDEILASASYQKAVKDVNEYAGIVRELKTTLTTDGQVDLGPTLRKQLDFSKLRACLNTANSALDEDTQKGTDRLIRGILQDITGK